MLPENKFGPGPAGEVLVLTHQVYPENGIVRGTGGEGEAGVKDIVGAVIVGRVVVMVIVGVVFLSGNIDGRVHPAKKIARHRNNARQMRG